LLFEEILKNQDSNYFAEYLEYRQLSKEESLKEIKIKLTSHKAMLIKLQGYIDYYFERIIRENNLEKLNEILEESLQGINQWN
jgi:CRISPR/Cas system CSM-associated protein Csm2 small subunit